MNILPSLRPKTRGDCVDGPRPCQWSTCRHWLDPVASLTYRSCPSRNRPVNVEPASCSLDVADRGRHSADAVGAMLGISHGRVQQIETVAISKLRRRRELRGLLDGWTHPADAGVWADAEEGAR